VLDTTAEYIFSLAVFKDYLYAGDYPNGKIYRSNDGITWVEVEDTNEENIYALTVFNGYLYASAGTSNGKIYRSSDGTTWVEIENNTTDITSLAVFNGYLYAGSNGTIYRVGGGFDLYSNYDIPLDEWIHIAVTYNGTIVKMYLNSIIDNTMKSQITIDTNSFDLLIGNSYGTTIGCFSSTGEENFNGTIDEVRIYNRSLSEGEIKAHYERRKYANPEPTLSYGPEEMYQKYMPFGTYTSTVFDSGGNATTWDTIEWGELLPFSTNITLATRSGNTSNPDDGTWSSWSPEIINSSGRPIISPRSRYIQYRATLASSNRSVTPSLLEVNIYYETNSVNPPTLSSPDNGNWTSNPRPTFIWIFNDPDLDSQNGFTIEIDDDRNFGPSGYKITETNSASENWAALFSIPDGTYFWHVKTKDEHGLWSDWSENWSLNIDRTAPDPPMNPSVDPDIWTNINSFTIDWTNPTDFSGVVDGCWYKIGSPPTSNSDGTWTDDTTLTVTSSDGEQIVYIWLEDKVGNVNYLNYSTVTLYLDSVPPSINHAPPTDGVFGEPITITAEITDNVAVKSAILFYRKTGDSEWSNVTMTKDGDEYSADIPGSFVTMEGIQYYIEAADEVNAVKYPSLAPPNNFFNLTILDMEPPEISHNPITNGTENQIITISATITDNVGVTGAFLFYRIMDAANWESIPMTQNVHVFSADIPASFVTTDGIEYYIWATDDTFNSTHPIIDPQTAPHEITITEAEGKPDPKEEADFVTTWWWLLLLLFIVVALLVFLLSRRREEEGGIGLTAEQEIAAMGPEGISEEVAEEKPKPEEPGEIIDQEIPKESGLPEEEPEPVEVRGELGTAPKPVPPLTNTLMTDDEIFDSIKKKYEEGKISQETFEEIEKRYKKK
jgi:hypothetical protein